MRWTNRISNEPLQLEFLRAVNRGVTLSSICRVLAEEVDPRWMRIRPDRSAHADTTKLRRSLGLKAPSHGKMIETVDINVAKAICKALDLDYKDLYKKRTRKICPCGEEHYGDHVLCQFCIEDPAIAA